MERKDLELSVQSLMTFNSIVQCKHQYISDFRTVRWENRFCARKIIQIPLNFTPGFVQHQFEVGCISRLFTFSHHTGHSRSCWAGSWWLCIHHPKPLSCLWYDWGPITCWKLVQRIVPLLRWALFIEEKCGENKYLGHLIRLLLHMSLCISKYLWSGQM